MSNTKGIGTSPSANETIKNMLSYITVQKIPFTNIEIYKNKNTHLVNLLFENRKLVRLIREKNNKS